MTFEGLNSIVPK